MLTTDVIDLAKKNLDAATLKANSGLYANPQVKSLNFSGNPIGRGVETVVAKLESHPGLRSLSLSDDLIFDVTVTRIAKLLLQNNLIALDISGNMFTEMGGLTILAALHLNTSLQTLNIDNLFLKPKLLKAFLSVTTLTDQLIINPKNNFPKFSLLTQVNTCHQKIKMKMACVVMLQAKRQNKNIGLIYDKIISYFCADPQVVESLASMIPLNGGIQIPERKNELSISKVNEKAIIDFHYSEKVNSDFELALKNEDTKTVALMLITKSEQLKSRFDFHKVINELEGVFKELQSLLSKKHLKIKEKFSETTSFFAAQSNSFYQCHQFYYLLKSRHLYSESKFKRLVNEAVITDNKKAKVVISSPVSGI